jgi:hypothetical protein
MNSKKKLNLPTSMYGPICMKILKDFIEHHKIPADLALPQQGCSTIFSLNCIFNAMIETMGEEKRNALIKEVEEYSMSLPAAFRG